MRKLFLTAAKEAMNTQAQTAATTTAKERKGARSAWLQYLRQVLQFFNAVAGAGALHLPAMKQLTQPTAAPNEAEARKVARWNSGMLMSDRMAAWLSSTYVRKLS